MLLILGLFLSSCSSTSVLDKGSESNIEKISTSTPAESDTYYLQIAKDLYVARQYKQAYQISSKLAEKNNAEAQYLLGYLLYYGQGVPADIKQGTKWINISADADYRPAIEALVLIKHGLTPDNKCPSNIELPETNIENSVKKKQPENKDLITKSHKLKEGELIVTPQGNAILAEAPKMAEKNAPKSKVMSQTDQQETSKTVSKKNASAYTLQVASYRKKSNADALQKKLLKSKYKAYIELIMAAGGKTYRLKIGPYRKFENILTIKKQVEKQFSLTNTIIVKY